MHESTSTIRFTAELPKANSFALLTLPASANARLTSASDATVEGTMNAFPFRASLESNGKATHVLKVSRALLAAAQANAGDTVTIEITRIGNEPEVRLPEELIKALAVAPKAQATWNNITPLARRDWILWITSAKQAETRLLRIKKACSILASGKKRVCCFGGLNWLTKEHPDVPTWAPLPVSKNSKKKTDLDPRER